MEIQKAKQSQLLEILYIIRECAYQLKTKGVKHWHNTHIDYEQIDKDIKDGFVYILTVRKGPVGTITVKPDSNNPSISHLDRLAIFPHFQRRGFAKKLIDFAIEDSINSGRKLLQGVIPVNDQSICNLLEEKGFENKGVLHHVPEELTKIVFEKKL